MSKIKNNTGITSKDFYEDFTEEVGKGKRIIIFLSHGLSYAKEYSFLAYTNKQFNFSHYESKIFSFSGIGAWLSIMSDRA